MIITHPITLRIMRIMVPLYVCWLIFITGCKSSEDPAPKQTDVSLSFTVNNNYNGTLKYTGLNTLPVVKINFTEAVDVGSATVGIGLSGSSVSNIPLALQWQNDNKTVTIKPQNNLAAFTSYSLSIKNVLKSASGGKLLNPVSIQLSVGIDSTDKFPQITDEELLTKVQERTFKYFYDFGHPTSGLARERNTSGDIVTTGGTGFGVMALIVGVHRNFITRTEGLARMQKIVGFLKNNAQRFHGAYPHWLNGSTGTVIPFGTKDNGADLVETSFLMQGLIAARQYFNRTDIQETALRNDINSIYNAVEWSWFRKNNENVLYWHWSPDYDWEMNLPIGGWDEALITYVMAASSPTYPIPKAVYDNGWAHNGSIKNGNTYYGIVLPFGSPKGGPLFFEHYSFLGINPIGLTDAYGNYEAQVKAHSLINYKYCIANPNGYYGYSEDCWGLTASDIPNGYSASAPDNDLGVIAPTAALSSFPYTPNESMKALKFFYYKLGDRIWKDYGFVDAFSLKDPWFATSTLAIDQGPIIVMIENYRSHLLWDLFMSAPEVKAGMTNLGFKSPHL